MSKDVFVGVSNKARKIKKLYVGVGGKARKVKKAYIGVNGKAKLFFSAVELSASYLTLRVSFTYNRPSNWSCSVDLPDGSSLEKTNISPSETADFLSKQYGTYIIQAVSDDGEAVASRTVTFSKGGATTQSVDLVY